MKRLLGGTLVLALTTLASTAPYPSTTDVPQTDGPPLANASARVTAGERFGDGGC